MVAMVGSEEVGADMLRLVMLFHLLCLNSLFDVHGGNEEELENSFCHAICNENTTLHPFNHSRVLELLLLHQYVLILAHSAPSSISVQFPHCPGELLPSLLSRQLPIHLGFRLTLLRRSFKRRRWSLLRFKLRYWPIASAR